MADPPPVSIKHFVGFNSIYFLGRLYFHANVADIAGLTVSLGQQFLSWNYGLNGGFWVFFGITLFVASAYLCLVLCLAEMTSTLPFSGGSYGLARVTLGPFWGYMMGVADSIEFTLRACIAIAGIGDILVKFTPNLLSLQAAYWLLAYIVLGWLNNNRAKIFWNVSTVLAIISIVILILYVFSTAAVEGNFNLYVTEDSHINYSDARNDTLNFVQFMPVATKFYMGLEVLPLACSDVLHAKVNVPKAMLGSFATVFLSSIVVLFACASQTPGVSQLASAAFPLSFGFSSVYNMPPIFANLFTLPAVIATAYGYTFAYSKQISAMAKSKLFLVSFTKCCGEQRLNLITQVIAALIGLCALLLTSKVRRVLYNICLMGGLAAYLGNFVSFIIFRNTYGALKRSFTNPLGVGSALYGICVYLIVFVSAAYYQNDNWLALFLFACWVGWAFFGYFCLSRRSQTYSAEEQAIMFLAYVIKANKKRKKRILVNARKHNLFPHHQLPPPGLTGIPVGDGQEMTVTLRHVDANTRTESVSITDRQSVSIGANTVASFAQRLYDYDAAHKNAVVSDADDKGNHSSADKLAEKLAVVSLRGELQLELHPEAFQRIIEEQLSGGASPKIRRTAEDGGVPGSGRSHISGDSRVQEGLMVQLERRIAPAHEASPENLQNKSSDTPPFASLRETPIVSRRSTGEGQMPGLGGHYGVSSARNSNASSTTSTTVHLRKTQILDAQYQRFQQMLQERSERSLFATVKQAVAHYLWTSRVQPQPGLQTIEENLEAEAGSERRGRPLPDVEPSAALRGSLDTLETEEASFIEVDYQDFVEKAFREEDATIRWDLPQDRAPEQQHEPAQQASMKESEISLRSKMNQRSGEPVEDEVHAAVIHHRELRQGSPMRAPPSTSAHPSPKNPSPISLAGRISRDTQAAMVRFNYISGGSSNYNSGSERADVPHEDA